MKRLIIKNGRFFISDLIRDSYAFGDKINVFVLDYKFLGKDKVSYLLYVEGENEVVIFEPPNIDLFSVHHLLVNKNKCVEIGAKETRVQEFFFVCNNDNPVLPPIIGDWNLEYFARYKG